MAGGARRPRAHARRRGFHSWPARVLGHNCALAISRHIGRHSTVYPSNHRLSFFAASYWGCSMLRWWQRAPCFRRTPGGLFVPRELAFLEVLTGRSWGALGVLFGDVLGVQSESSWNVCSFLSESFIIWGLRRHILLHLPTLYRPNLNPQDKR